MKTGRTLPELSHELQRQADAKRDFLAPARSLKVRSNGRTDLLPKEPVTVSDITHGQLADYLGIPRSFYERLRSGTGTLTVPLLTGRNEAEDGPAFLLRELEEAPLLDVAVNTLLRNKGEDGRLIRTLDGKARAFLSDSFNPDFDNFDVFLVAARVILEAGLSPENVVSAEVTERRLYIKVVSPKLESVIRPDNLKNAHGLLKEPQVVRAGFVIQNSECGLGALSVQQVVMKLMCANLWIAEMNYKRRHVGKVLESDEDGQVYKSDTRMADAKARLLKLRDHVTEALDETRFKALVSRMQETTEVKLEGKLDKIVEVTARKLGLSSGEKDSVLTNLIEGADLSLWGLTNAVTATAQTAASYDRATELEALGGRFFSLSAPEIREIARAA